MAIKKILVVDDSDVDRGFLVKILQRNGFETVEAVDGDNAVDIVESVMPDLILMDVVMPKMSGFEACRKITLAPATQHIPVIICSSKGLKTDAMWGKRQGASEYVVKPVDPKELLAKIATFNK